jgi:hypothetical protein
MAREIANLAQHQLAQWESFAKRWNLIGEYRDDGIHLVCAGYENHETDVSPFGPCWISIYTISVSHIFRLIKNADLLALTVAHIRNNHREIEGVVYGERE